MSDRFAALGRAVERAEKVAELSIQLVIDYELGGAESMLAAHLVVAHGWGVDAAAQLSREDRLARHAALSHGGDHHH